MAAYNYPSRDPLTRDVALRMLDPVKVRIGIDDSRIHPKLKLTIVEPRLPTLHPP